MNVNDMSYRQWQKRNTDTFQQLTKAQQQLAYQQGYCNVGRHQVQHSWIILQRVIKSPSLFNAKLKKGDLAGAVDQSILEAKQTQHVDGKGYREWQKRNTETFQQLTKAQQQLAREQGYRNVGWQQVQQSWEILQQLTKTPNLFDAKLKKGDLPGAINQSILEAEQAQEIAKQGVSSLKRKHNQIQELAEKTLDKYQLL